MRKTIVCLVALFMTLTIFNSDLLITIEGESPPEKPQNDENIRTATMSSHPSGIYDHETPAGPLFEQYTQSYHDNFFTANRGQVGCDDVSFYIRGQGTWFLSSGVVFKLMEPLERTATTSERSGMSTDTRKELEPANRLRESAVVSFDLVNCNDVTPYGRGELPHKSNFFYGSDPSKWCTDVPNYNEIFFENIYNNIDLRYYFNKAGLKYDFIVHPGGDPNDIAIEVTGVDDLILGHSDNDTLILRTGSAEIVDSNLFVYQDVEGTTKEVRADFKIIGTDTYGFHISGTYEADGALIIDPLIYSTFIGGSDADWANDIELDENNNLIIAGGTNSSDFPFNGADMTPVNESYLDIYILKLSADGGSLLFSSFIGGNGHEEVRALAVDPLGNYYITGITNSSNFPTLADSYDAFYNGNFDVFVTKLGPDGNVLKYSTYIGGNSWDECQDITVDDSGNAYLTGSTMSYDFPVTLGAYRIEYIFGTVQAFILKLEHEGSKLNCSTFFGGKGPVPLAFQDMGVSIALTDNSICILGQTASPGFPATEGAYDTQYDGSSFSVFISKFSLNLSVLLYSTIFEGSGQETPDQMFIDSANNIYIVGFTISKDLPMTTDAYDPSWNGGLDGFVAKFNSNLSSLLYSTYFGGEWVETVVDAAVDDKGNICITGYTSSKDFPVTENAFDKSHNGNYDIFTTVFNLNYPTLIYSSFFGSPGWDISRAITIDKEGFIYISGGCDVDFPTTPGSYDPNFNGGENDAFALKLELNCTPLAVDLNVTPPDVYRPANIDISSRASDFEDDIEDLTPHFEWLGPYQPEWTPDLLSPPVLINGIWWTALNVSTETHVGYYSFRVRYNDTDNRWAKWLYNNNSLHVLNNLPYVNYFNLTKSTVVIDEELELVVNASDVEDDIHNLTFTIQYRSSGVTWWDMLNYSAVNYTGLENKYTFSISSDKPYGYYDFRVCVRDKENDFSEWEYLIKALQVNPAPPRVISITVVRPIIYRTEIMEVHVNCTDPDSIREEIYVELQYMAVSDGEWLDLSVDYMNERWESYTKSKTTWTPGYYNFRAKAVDMDDNEGRWFYANDSLEVLNNLPEITSVGNLPNTIQRGSSIIIRVDSLDKEDAEEDLAVELEMQLPGDNAWTPCGQTIPYYSDHSWHYELSYPVTAVTGLYGFRFYVEDLDGDLSNYYYMNDSLLVENAVPRVLSFTQSPSAVFRSETITITTNGSDIETKHGNLQCTMQYREHPVTSWKTLTPSYDPDAMMWSAELRTTTASYIGNYSFKVTFTDRDMGSSGEVYSNMSVYVKNNLPTISPELDDIQVGKRPVIVNLTEFGYDPETPGKDLRWFVDKSGIRTGLFQIDDDNISSHEIVFYPGRSQKGEYDITLILMDADSGKAVRSDVTVIVDSRSEPDDDEPEDDDPMTRIAEGSLIWLYILIIIIIAVLIMLFIFYRRKKKLNEEEDQKKKEEAEKAEEESRVEAKLEAAEQVELPVVEPAAEPAAALEPAPEPAPVPMPAPAEIPQLPVAATPTPVEQPEPQPETPSKPQSHIHETEIHEEEMIATPIEQDTRENDGQLESESTMETADKNKNEVKR